MISKSQLVFPTLLKSKIMVTNMQTRRDSLLTCWRKRQQK